MNKPDKTKNKGSGPKEKKGKGHGSKDSISEITYVGNEVLNTKVTHEKKRIEVVFESNKPAYEIHTSTIPKIKNREDYLLESKFDDLKISLNTEIRLSEFFNNKLLIIQAIEKGISFSIFESIKNVTTLTTSDWADYLGLSSRSLNRYFIQNKTFSPIYSEKIIELVEVFKLGLEVFGEQNSFNQWLNTPNFALGNIKPAELLKNSYGKEMVISELTGISHGILV